MTADSKQSDGQSGRDTRAMRVGEVVSDKGDKTIKVRFDFTVKHPKYGKYMRRSSFLHAHDGENQAKTGDVVELMSCRPISKTKCWRLTRVVKSS
jgi:small subunit ribosomal protein S17